MLIRPSVSIYWGSDDYWIKHAQHNTWNGHCVLGKRYPERQAVMETVGGFLLIGGLSLMGYALEAVLGHP